MGVDVTSAILASIVSGTVAIAILFRRPRRPLYQHFSAFTLSLFLYHAAAVAQKLSAGALKSLRMYAALLIAATAGLFFRELLRDRTRTGQRLSRSAILISAILALVALTPLGQEAVVRFLCGAHVVITLGIVLHGLYSTRAPAPKTSDGCGRSSGAASLCCCLPQFRQPQVSIARSLPRQRTS